MKPANNEHDPCELLSVPTVARLLDVSTTTVYGLLADGRLKGIRVGNLWRINRQALSAYLEQPEGARSV